MAVEPAQDIRPRARWARLRVSRGHAETTLICLSMVLAVTAATVYRSAPVWMALAVAAVAIQRSWQVRRSLGVAAWSHAHRLLRSLLVPMALGVTLLHLLPVAPLLVDQLVLLGVAAALAGAGASFALAALAPRPRVVVVGTAAEVSDLTGRWGEDSPLRLVAAVATDTAALPASDLRIERRLDRLRRLIARTNADLVLVAPHMATRPDEFRRMCWQLEGLSVRVLAGNVAEHVMPHRLSHEVVDGTTLTVVSGSAPMTSRVVKNLGDRLLGGLLVLLAAPVIAVLAVLVRLDSRGPAFFVQTRVGRDGAPFRMFKLRTMVVDAAAQRAELTNEDGNGVLFKLRQDPRVTRVGRLLRATSLDELPQLLNVVRGDMSLVGPRPALPEEVEQYDELERRRLAVRPGLTGPWQVSGRSSLSRERSRQLDAGYADNWGPVDDMRILLRTVDAVVTRRGAF